MRLGGRQENPLFLWEGPLAGVDVRGGRVGPLVGWGQMHGGAAAGRDIN
jgi:hypothetical protein